ncbi:MAG: helix-turn-helix domain-containing protein [Treponema sp.]|nr:helix-turn-helix domain-containing protein [Treponema sp.]MCL2272978.1 helix-turn-helix domain-containing protein [Treponema sp.]
MGFKENLKSELAYKGMLVKELAQKSGISRHTLDNYLNVREHIPTMDAAVKIAKALEVSVEYLATGEETPQTVIKKNKENITLLQNYNHLNKDDKKIVDELVQLLLKYRRKNHQK